MKQGDIVEILWLDAWANSHGRYDPHWEYKPLLMRTLGYLVEENETGILTATTRRHDDEYVGETFTPWEMIVKLEVLV